MSTNIETHSAKESVQSEQASLKQAVWKQSRHHFSSWSYDGSIGDDPVWSLSCTCVRKSVTNFALSTCWDALYPPAFTRIPMLPPHEFVTWANPWWKRRRGSAECNGQEAWPQQDIVMVVSRHSKTTLLFHTSKLKLTVDSPSASKGAVTLIPRPWYDSSGTVPASFSRDDSSGTVPASFSRDSGLVEELDRCSFAFFMYPIGASGNDPGRS